MSIESIQDRIAQTFGYEDAADQEADEQYQVEVNWCPKDGNAKTGCIYKNDKGILQLYWYPSEEHPVVSSPKARRNRSHVPRRDRT
jgi:hypothetical protein